MTSNQYPQSSPGLSPACLGNNGGSAPGWGQPHQSARPTAPEAHLPSLRTPMAVTTIGTICLLAGAALFVTPIMTVPVVTPEAAATVPHDGTSTSTDLLAEQLYGFYSQDAGARCTVKDPSGTDVEVSPLPSTAQTTVQQVLAFTSRAAGTYSLSCEATQEVAVNLAITSDARSRAQLMFMISFPLAGVGLAALLAGSIWLAVRRRARAALVLSRLHPGLASQARPGAAPQRGPRAQPGPSAPSGSYGIAPQQVVYRPVPGPGEHPPVQPPR